MLPQLFARRYLFSSQSRSVVNLISGLSVAAVAMPVAAMIILLSVFNGFESLVKSMYSAFDADLTVSPRQGQTFAQRDLDTAALARIPGVGLFKGGLPLDVGVGVLEVVVVAVPARLCKVCAQLAVGQRGGVQAGVHAGLVQRHRVKGRKDADIRQDGCIVLAVAVAVGADVLHQRNKIGRASCRERV